MTYWAVPIWVVLRNVQGEFENSLLIQALSNEQNSQPHCKANILQSVDYKRRNSWQNQFHSALGDHLQRQTSLIKWSLDP